VILVENLSVPSDQRVWQEALSLHAAGYEVAIVCPAGQQVDRLAYEYRDGIEIHRYTPRPAKGTPASYIMEYAQALWAIRRLIRHLTRAQSLDVLHACNPPDLLLLAGVGQKRRGTRFIFDHHDLVPELYLSRFGNRRSVLYRISLLLERLTFRLADVVIATNESYRQLATTRGGMSNQDVFVVRNAPAEPTFRAAEPDPTLKRGRPHLISYVGVIAPQDGVDVALRALAALKKKRDDWTAVFVGDGDALPAVRKLAEELELGPQVEFAGWLERSEVQRVLSTSDVCLAPEPASPLNNVSTMVKIVEYMAMSRAIVCFDLPESRASAGAAALYAASGDIPAFAQNIAELLDQPELRANLGAKGRDRFETSLSWASSERQLLAAYARALQK
jgi:glycosyltransferase involved in cell wall biosynthesis